MLSGIQLRSLRPLYLTWRAFHIFLLIMLALTKARVLKCANRHLAAPRLVRAMPQLMAATLDPHFHGRVMAMWVMVTQGLIRVSPMATRLFMAAHPTGFLGQEM